MIIVLTDGLELVREPSCQTAQGGDTVEVLHPGA
jgi:hypothetical protein